MAKTVFAAFCVAPDAALLRWYLNSLGTFCNPFIDSMTTLFNRSARAAFLILFAGILSGCMSPRSFPDPNFSKVSYEELVRPEQPKKVKVTVQFQRNGEHLPQVDAGVLDSTERILRASGLLTPNREQAEGSINVVINNIADLSGAVGKGLGTGLTLGLAGSTVTDVYEMRVRIEIGGKKFTRTGVKHSLHTAIGRTDTPEGIETMPAQAAFERVFEQMLLQVLKEYRNSPEFSATHRHHWLG